MHFHLPKPMHGWREFAGEVGIIVIGVSIALGAEQVMETLHWRHDVAEAEQSMNAELAAAEGTGFEIMTTQDCRQRQLAALDAIIDGRAVPSGMAVDLIGLRPWSTSTWQAAVASGAIAHMKPDERQRYAQLFGLVLTLRELHVDAYETSSDLKSINHHTALTDVSRDRFAQEISRIRQLSSMIALGSRQLLDSAKPMHIRIPDRFEANARHFRCVVPTAPVN